MNGVPGSGSRPQTESDMAKKVILNADVFTVPLNKLTLSPRNVRKTYSPAEIEEMAASIAAPGRDLIQNLGVAEQMDDQGAATGMWEVVAGGRRFRALTLLLERKRLAASAVIPCRRIAGENAVDTSLAENEDRKALHPADAYEAFAELHKDGKGVGIEEIAARFSVSVHTVRQRLRLGKVSPAIMVAYREGKLTLDHVMAYTITEDHDAQEHAFTDLPEWQRTPQAIRRLLTQASIPVQDPRVRLVGLDAYQAAGGRVQRDLFTEDGGGWLTDPALLERLVVCALQAAADQVQAESWKWIVTDPAAARTAWHSTRRVWPVTVALSDSDQVRRDELAQHLDELGAEYPYGVEDAPEDVHAEAQAIQTELQELDDREQAFRPDDVACGGSTIVLTSDGTLRIERGFSRPEDEPLPEPSPQQEEEGADTPMEGEPAYEDAEPAEQDDEGANHTIEAIAPEPASADKAPALPAELKAELTGHRTAALRVEIMR
jgi:ParB family chromosome partitioning protein